MKNRKMTALIPALIICAALAGMTGLRAAAAPSTVSAGNFSAEEGKVAFYHSDIIYLKNEISALQGEIDYSILPAASPGNVEVSATGSRRNLLHSRGTVSYDGGQVVISAADLLSFADGIDALDKDYRVMMTTALGSIGTCFDADGNASHAAEGGGFVPSSCGQLMAGLLRSQSVDHMSASPVSPENITAGAAAWVNGRCIIGNGADNERNYQRGLEDGRTGNGEDVDIQYTYHMHVTDDGQEGWDDGYVFSRQDSPGGCFTDGYHEHDGECPISEAQMVQVTYHDYTDGCGWHNWEDKIACQHQCTYCHEIHSHDVKASEWNGTIPGANPCSAAGSHRHYACGDLPVNTWAVGCGKTAGQIESATIYIRDKNSAGEETS